MARTPHSLTRAQLEARKAKAVRFTRDVIGDPGRAAEIQAESLEDYAGRRHIQITNPNWRYTVPRKTLADYRAELREVKGQIRDLEEENQTLQDQLDQIGDIIAPEEDEDEDEEADTLDADDEEDGDQD